MPTNEVEQALDVAPESVDVGLYISSDECRVLLAEYKRLRAELDRLTTLRPASEHEEYSWVIEWSREDGEWISGGVTNFVADCHWWTPLPKPKESGEPQD